MSEPGTDTTAVDALVIVPAPSPAERLVEPVVEQQAHVIELREVGPFTTAACLTCDYRSFARRSRQLARDEGADHARLYTASPMGLGS